jgi:hypothetical protein
VRSKNPSPALIQSSADPAPSNPVRRRAKPAVASAYGRTARFDEPMIRTPPSPYHADTRRSTGVKSRMSSMSDGMTSVIRPPSPMIWKLSDSGIATPPPNVELLATSPKVSPPKPCI